MEWRDLALALFAIVSTVGGWFMRALYSEIREQRKDFAKLPETYVRRDDYRQDMTYIRERLDTIVERLPAKE